MVSIINLNDSKYKNTNTNTITAFRTLTDEKSPFFNILGNIKDLPYFMFNNKAYFTKDIDNFSNIYDNNTMNFGRLLKHVFNLKKFL